MLDPVADQATNRAELRSRQTMRIVLAVCLIWAALSATSNAGDPCQLAVVDTTDLQFDGFTPTPIEAGWTVKREGDQPIDARAAYVQLYAELSNFDHDADADGWQASVVIRDQAGDVIVAPARATFEVFEHADRYSRHSTRQSFVRARPLARWSMALNFDQQGVAPVTLPASTSIMSTLGWDSQTTIHAGTRVAAYHRNQHWNRNQHWSRIRTFDRNRNFVTRNVRDRIDFPATGWLRVRVSIPGQRPLEAIAPIDTRPAVLVDKPWRYR